MRWTRSLAGTTPDQGLSEVAKSMSNRAMFVALNRLKSYLDGRGRREAQRLIREWNEGHQQWFTALTSEPQFRGWDALWVEFRYTPVS